MFGAVAAGVEAGGYATITDAAQAMARSRPPAIAHSGKRSDIRQDLSRVQAAVRLLWCGENDVMKRLRQIRQRPSRKIGRHGIGEP